VKICVYTSLLFEVAAFPCDIGPSIFDGIGRGISHIPSTPEDEGLEYSSIILNTGRWKRESASVPVPTVQDVEWAPEPVWTLRLKIKSSLRLTN
jgi:hypothetical protein